VRHLIASTLAAVLCGGLAAPAAAEFELDFYMGAQSAASSRAEGDRPGGGTYGTTFDWEGRSFEMPFYYGLRGTWWRSETFGWGVEGTHTKVYAPRDERDAAGSTDSSSPTGTTSSPSTPCAAGRTGGRG